jgi:type I restriction enzyme, S subunit
MQSAQSANQRKSATQTMDGYKHTPLGWVPVEWEVVSGDELTIKITKGASPNWQGFNYQSNGVLFVTSENVRDGFLDIRIPKFLPIEFNKKQKNSILRKGDILINIVGASIGRGCMFNLETVANINQAVALFRLKKDIIPEYILQYLQLPKTILRLLSTQSDSARPNLSLADLKFFKFLLPPLPEQQKIAAILSTWDKAVELTRRLIEAKEEQKKGLMQRLLTGKVRVKGFEGEWTEYEFSDVFAFVSTYAFSRENLSNETTPDSIYNIHYGDIHSFFEGNVIDFAKDKVPCIKQEIIVKSDQHFLRDGDLIMADASEDYEGVGECMVLKNLNGRKALGGLHTFVIRDQNGLTASTFRPYLFNNTEVRNKLRRIATGISVYGISKKNLSKISLSLPSIKEQEEIAKLLITADNEVKLLKDKLAGLKEQKKGLMQRLLTGKTRVKP